MVPSELGSRDTGSMCTRHTTGSNTASTHGGFYGEKRVFTLRVSQLTAEDYSVKAIMHMLENIDPNALMDTYRHVHAHVASNETEFGVHVRSTFSPTAA
jgi:hypothetical protein